MKAASTRTPPLLKALPAVLLVAAAGAVTTSMNSPEDKGYVAFRVYWLPKGDPSAVLLTNLMVNDVRYPSPGHPEPHTDGINRSYWDSPRFPNERPAEAVTANLTITIRRRPGDSSRLWLGCMITVDGRNAPGFYSVKGQGTNTRMREPLLTFTCSLPFPGA